jgi:hypothetical protein
MHCHLVDFLITHGTVECLMVKGFKVVVLGKGGVGIETDVHRWWSWHIGGSPGSPTLLFMFKGK